MAITKDLSERLKEQRPRLEAGRRIAWSVLGNVGPSIIAIGLLAFLGFLVGLVSGTLISVGMLRATLHARHAAGAFISFMPQFIYYALTVTPVVGAVLGAHLGYALLEPPATIVMLIRWIRQARPWHPAMLIRLLTFIPWLSALLASVYSIISRDSADPEGDPTAAVNALIYAVVGTFFMVHGFTLGIILSGSLMATTRRGRSLWGWITGADVYSLIAAYSCAAFPIVVALLYFALTLYIPVVPLFVLAGLCFAWSHIWTGRYRWLVIPAAFTLLLEAAVLIIFVVIIALSDPPEESAIQSYPTVTREYSASLPTSSNSF